MNVQEVRGKVPQTDRLSIRPDERHESEEAKREGLCNLAWTHGIEEIHNLPRSLRRRRHIRSS
jgi:hypothetical protein